MRGFVRGGISVVVVVAVIVDGDVVDDETPVAMSLDSIVLNTCRSRCCFAVWLLLDGSINLAQLERWPRVREKESFILIT